MPGFSIVTNVNSLLAQENLSRTNQLQTTTIARLTSGLRINSSADDAAGLAVANRFRSDIAVLRQGVRNAADGLSTLQTIDGGLNYFAATPAATSPLTPNPSPLVAPGPGAMFLWDAAVDVPAVALAQVRITLTDACGLTSDPTTCTVTPSRRRRSTASTGEKRVEGL